MGLHHIVSVSNDSLEQNKDRRDEVESALGKAIFTVCADPQYGHLGKPQAERVKWAEVLNHGSAVRHVAEFHSSEYDVLIFSNGQLRSIKDLNGEERSELMEYIQGLPSS